MRTALGPGRRRGAVVLVLGAILLVPGSALAAKPKPGHYSGTTEQGHPISFDVQKKGKKRSARNLEFTVEAPCQNGSIEAGQLLPTSEKISKEGKFSYGVFSDYTAEVKGKFTSKTLAKGTLRYTAITGVVGSCDSGPVSWEAQRG